MGRLFFMDFLYINCIFKYIRLRDQIESSLTFLGVQLAIDMRSWQNILDLFYNSDIHSFIEDKMYLLLI